MLGFAPAAAHRSPTAQVAHSQLPALQVHRPLRRCARCAAEQCEVSICVNKTCKKQGSSQNLACSCLPTQILQLARDLHMEGVTIRSSGCLANCGHGPNIAVDPPGVILNHMATPAKFAEAMRAVVGADVSEAVLRTTELRLAGNQLARQGDLQAACASYTEALELAVVTVSTSLEQDDNGSHRHLLLANRSGALLALGEHEGALRDANAAADCGPASFHTAYIRQIEAHAAMKNYQAAVDALAGAAQRDPAFMKTSEYKSVDKQLRNLVRQPVGV